MQCSSMLLLLAHYIVVLALGLVTDTLNQLYATFFSLIDLTFCPELSATIWPLSHVFSQLCRVSTCRCFRLRVFIAATKYHDQKGG